MAVNRCGTCRHTEPVPNDLTRVTCYGGPPQLIMVQQQTPAGVQVVPTGAHPQVARTERACAVYAAKLLDSVLGADHPV